MEIITPIKNYIKTLINHPQAMQRLEICNTCEDADKEHIKCLRCGCYLKAKVMFPNSHCPIGKW